MINVPTLLATNVIGGKKSFSRTFAAVYGQLPAADNVTSRKAYPANIPADAVITVSAGAQYRLMGADWTSLPGVWGTNRYIEVRGPAHADYGAAEIHTVYFNAGEIAEASLDFAIWTVADPTLLNATFQEDGAAWTMEDGTAILQEG